MKNMLLWLVVFLVIVPCDLHSQMLNTNSSLAEEMTSKFVSVPNPIEYAKKESIGGDMDFKALLKEQQAILFLLDGVAYNKEDFAILLWAAAAKKIAMKDLKTAKNIWEEVHNQELAGPDLKAFKKGYKLEL